MNQLTMVTPAGIKAPGRQQLQPHRFGKLTWFGDREAVRFGHLMAEDD
jgi:hypothetical protein